MDLNGKNKIFNFVFIYNRVKNFVHYLNLLSLVVKRKRNNKIEQYKFINI